MAAGTPLGRGIGTLLNDGAVMRKILAAGALIVWGAGLSVLCARLMARHWVPLPRPDVSDPAWVGRGSASAAATEPAWLAVHVVSEGCPCSRRLLDHLRSRGPVAGVRERVVRVRDGEFSPSPALPGFEEESIDADELAGRYGVDAVPMMLVFDPDGVPVYAGGHTPRKQSADFRDRWILTELTNSRPAGPLPVFGCPLPTGLTSTERPLFSRIP